MITRIFWIDTGLPGRLAIMPRPQGGPDLPACLQAIRQEGTDIVVSLLGSYEVTELALRDEAIECEKCSLSFRALPIEDRGLPDHVSPVRRLAEELLTEIRQGKSVVIHCRMGIGRSTVLAASILILAGMDDAEAIHRIQQARGCPVPDTQAQRDWITEFARVNRSEG